MHSTPLIIISVYLVVLFGVTWWARRLTSADSGFGGYLLAGRQLPSWVSAAQRWREGSSTSFLLWP